MIRIKVLLVLWWMLMPLVIYSQQKCLSGQLIDVETNKPIQGVNIALVNNSRIVVSDSIGRFKICDLSQAIVTLQFTHLAYQSHSIEANTESVIRVFLVPKNHQFQEVVVSSQSANSSKEMPGQQKINQAQIFSMPTLLGEADVIRTLQQLPGVQSANEGVAGIFVRGGSAGQNMVTLDGMELMNPVHLMGIYSVFNPLTTSSAEVFKGNTPVTQRSKIASSIDAHSFNPFTLDNSLMGSIGNIASNLAVSLKSKNNKWGLVGGVRRSYLEAMRSLTSTMMSDESNYFNQYFYSFYDVNGLLIYKPAIHTSISFGWYLGADDFNLNEISSDYDAGSSYGNKSLKLEIKSLLWSKVILSTSVNGTRAWSGFKGDLIGNSVSFNSEFDQISAKLKMTIPADKHLFSFGVDAYRYRTTPQKVYLQLINDTIQQQNDFYNDDVSIYFEDSYRLSNKINLYGGFRIYKYWNYNEVSPDHGMQRPAKPIDFYTPFAPLVAVSYSPSDHTNYKFSYCHNVQMTHLASLSSIPLPNDIWVMSSASLKPETAHQVSVAYNRSFEFGEFSTELYGKYLDNQLIYNVNTDKDNPIPFEDHFFKGIGKSYGVEFSLSKTEGKFTGMINYTLSKSLRSYPDIYNGEWFNDKFDRIHDVSLLANFKLNRKWDFGANWVFATGNCTTLPAGRYWAMGSVMNDYTGYNTFRMPSFHRLDVSANWHLSSRKFKQSVINFSVINLYNRSNPYFLFYKVYQGDSQYDIEIKASQISLFPIMPSINWRFYI